MHYTYIGEVHNGLITGNNTPYLLKFDYNSLYTGQEKCGVYLRAGTILLSPLLGFAYHLINPQEQQFFYI